MITMTKEQVEEYNTIYQNERNSVLSGEAIQGEFRMNKTEFDKLKNYYDNQSDEFSLLHQSKVLMAGRWQVDAFMRGHFGLPRCMF